jgi:hypothetical protein
MNKQRVWRTLSESNNNSGYFVWDVMEAEGETDSTSYFIPTHNGSHIIIYCFHFWTEEKALAFLHRDDYPSVYDLIIIS